MGRPASGGRPRLEIEGLEEIVRLEIERAAEAPPPDGLGGLWRALAGRPRPAGTRGRRWLFRFEDVARTVLHEVRRRRAP